MYIHIQYWISPTETTIQLLLPSDLIVTTSMKCTYVVTWWNSGNRIQIYVYEEDTKYSMFTINRTWGSRTAVTSKSRDSAVIAISSSYYLETLYSWILFLVLCNRVSNLSHPSKGPLSCKWTRLISKWLGKARELK